RPLAGMTIGKLNLTYTPVGDLSPLRGATIETLILGSGVGDLAPLAEIKSLKHLSCGIRRYFEPDEKMLHGLALESINGKKAADFWKELETNRKADDEWIANFTKTPKGKLAEALTAGQRDITVDNLVQDPQGAVLELSVTGCHSFERLR